MVKIHPYNDIVLGSAKEKTTEALNLYESPKNYGVRKARGYILYDCI